MPTSVSRGSRLGRSVLLSVGAPLVAAACTGASAPLAHAPEPVGGRPAPAASAAAAAVTPCELPSPSRGGFEHSRSGLVVALGKPHHGAVDPIVAAGESAEIYAKFTYGPLSKDLEHEPVEVSASLDPVEPGACPGFKHRGVARTSGDGAVRIALPATPAPGRYPFVLTVAGDASAAVGAVWVVAPAQRIVIFDVDGTLTEGDEALVEQLISGVSPPPRAGAAAVAQRHVALGATPVYLTGRPTVLAGMTRAWLREHGFPEGPVLTTTTAAAAMPTEDGVQRFKQDAITRLLERGLVVERAYGNALTDICAYARAGLPPAATFIAGSHGGKGCDGGPPTVAVASYEALLPALER